MKNARKLKRGFTLVELMAAMAITAILVVVIVALTRKGVDIWRVTLNDVRSTAQARVALDTLSSDLESVQVRAGNQFEWFLAEKDRDVDSRIDDEHMKMGPQGMTFTNASRLIFFTSATDRNPAIRSGEAANVAADFAARKVTSGDINCVGYKLEYRDQILNSDASKYSEGFPVYALYRNIVPAYRTYEDLLGRTNLYDAYRNFTANETRSLNFMVENIVEMTFVFEVDYQSSNSGATSRSDQSASLREIVNVPIIATGYSGANSYRKVAIFGDRIEVEKQGSSDQKMAYGNVVGVSISLTVVTDEGMTIVDEVRRGRRAAPNPAEFFKNYTKQYSQRISIPKPN